MSTGQDVAPADPILGLIAKYREAEDDFNENAIDPTEMYLLQDSALSARPQTLDAATAQLIFAAECTVEDLVFFSPDGVRVDGDSLILVACVNAARLIAGKEPKVSERLAAAVKAAEAWATEWRR